jgi:hypothetical protein
MVGIDQDGLVERLLTFRSNHLSTGRRSQLDINTGVENMNEKNVTIFERSLRAVDAVATQTLDFVLLQIGLGVYGGASSPQPWREDRCAGPNPRWNKYFYVGQMAFLKSFQKGKRWDGAWTITAPSLIFGRLVVDRNSFSGGLTRHRI